MITEKFFNKIFPTLGLTSPKNLKKFNLVRLRVELIDALNEFLPKYRINNAMRLRAFLSCCGIETDYFKTSREYHDGSDYEGRRDLGNVIEGDGTRFPGSSIIQTTGRYNFWRVTVRFVKKLTGKDFSPDEKKYKNFEAYLKSPEYDRLLKEADRLGVNFLANPRKLTEVRAAVEAACIFWEENNLNHYADARQIKELNAIVNRGDKRKLPMHWADRNALYTRCEQLIPANFSFASRPLPIVSTVGTGLPDTNVAPTNQPSEVPAPTEQTTPTGQSAAGSTVINNSTSVVVEQPVAVPESAIKRLFNKYWAHCPGDSVKNVLFVIAARISAIATALWNFGVSGKIFAFLIAFAAIVPIVWAIVKYRHRIWGWVNQHAESFIPNE